MQKFGVELSIVLEEFVDPHVDTSGVITNSACVLEKDQYQQQFHRLLLAGAQSTPTAPVDASCFDALCMRIKGTKSL